MEIRRSYDRRISTVGFPILVRWHLYRWTNPLKQNQSSDSYGIYQIFLPLPLSLLSLYRYCIYTHIPQFLSTSYRQKSGFTLQAHCYTLAIWTAVLTGLYRNGTPDVGPARSRSTIATPSLGFIRTSLSRTKLSSNRLGCHEVNWIFQYTSLLRFLRKELTLKRLMTLRMMSRWC